ncbi:TIGR02269 family lipoprotein [Pyxidicoccus sp. QH1ED-7-1]|uniref:SitA6 family polymorphic toxin lipoprotein n=1 Tax=Pyxidicoccus xibeiensis TaxID=2906759 RepID=UPI0020A824AC|nr:TIGR02269 family lipoprotein [Pyxidicoccus xibeiensis]MCP3144201.1 TIGR02269 family lipoprotein [Pyxidicoccus xibeiensis]
MGVLGSVACGTASPAVRIWEGAEQDETAACSEPGSDRCVVLACDEGECGLFTCDDVDAESVASATSASNVELAVGRPYIRGPGTYRNWWQRRTGIRGGARPLATARVPHRRAVFVQAMPSESGRSIKHHLFPQAPEFAAWFRGAGIDIHQFTMVIPENVHRQIHSGKGMGPGGAWNHAWRQFIIANPRPPPKDVIMRHSLELAFRFQLSGPIVPYNTPIVPKTPGPRIEAY